VNADENIRIEFEHEPQELSAGIYGGWNAWAVVNVAGMDLHVNVVVNESKDVEDWEIDEIEVYTEAGVYLGSTREKARRPRGVASSPDTLRDVPELVPAFAERWAEIVAEAEREAAALEEAIGPRDEGDPE